MASASLSAWHARRPDACRLAPRSFSLAVEVPGCPAGGVILFDFRLLHRGMPNNTGRDRALAHAFLATGGAQDQSIVPPSLRDAYDALPADRDERRRLQTAMATNQREAWLALRQSSVR